MILQNTLSNDIENFA